MAVAGNGVVVSVDSGRLAAGALVLGARGGEVFHDWNEATGDSGGGERRKSNRTLRREWEETTGKKWPKDPDNPGRNQDVSHKRAVADDGAPNDVDNIEPKPRGEHMDEHGRKGDFKRWGGRSQNGRKE